MNPRTPAVETDTRPRVVELFAGVGGFRLGLEGVPPHPGHPGVDGPWHVVWSNQWEPGTKGQHASDCYVHQFGHDGHVNEDIHAVLDEVERGEREIPDHDLLVGGFPCQDYSVAKPLNQAHGIEGKKGVLWWDIHRLLALKKKQGKRHPRFLLLENVDRMLKSPVSQRGRDFAVILSCLARLGYAVEWRVINAAEYGFPQRRRRVFLFAERLDLATTAWSVPLRLYEGVLARALPITAPADSKYRLNKKPDFLVDKDPYAVTVSFAPTSSRSPFLSGGVMVRNRVWTRNVIPAYHGPFVTLADVVETTSHVAESFYLDGDTDRWAYLKGAKNEKRTHKASGAEYRYSEGGMVFPDPLDRPARTILTGEGGRSPSRFKHVIEVKVDRKKRLRRLVPEELEALNGFPRGWTDYRMSDIKRGFMMGNALVVGVVERIGRSIIEEFD